MEVIVTLAIWALCSWACYSLAESKHRNAPLGACMGLLFGVIAVIIYVLLSDKKPTVDKSAQDNE